MKEIKAEIISDSTGLFDIRCTSFVLTYPRIIHAELLTHRLFSRSSASSRAIRFEKMLDMVKKDPFVPIAWQKRHKGMQGSEYFTDPKEILELENKWRSAVGSCSHEASILNDAGVTKQICNRLLEPVQWYQALFTATEWENFFALRAHPAAEIHIQELAFKMLEEYNRSNPKQLNSGQWHLPFGDRIDVDEENIKLKISTARCARISYLNFHGKEDYSDDLDLHDALLVRPYEGKRGKFDHREPIHGSPAEHPNRAMSEKEFFNHSIKKEVPESYVDTVDRRITKIHEKLDNENYLIEEFGWCANMRGFIPYRKMINNENRKDNRIRPWQKITDQRNLNTN